MISAATTSGRPAPRAGVVRLLAAATVLGTCMVLSACTGDASATDPGDLPVVIAAAPREVDACRLLRPVDASTVVGRRLVRVGLAYGAAQLPTLGCDLGEDFGVPEVTVALATGPVPLNVFEQAYGDEAGGDPVAVARLEPRAFLRSEQDLRSLHVFLRGSILSLTVRLDPTTPITRSQTIQLAQLAVARVPRHPLLAPTPTSRPCVDVGPGPLSAAIGAVPVRSSTLRGPAGALMCSWTSQPGSAVVTMLRSRTAIEAYLRRLRLSDYSDVPAVTTPPGVRALSRDDRPGDVLLRDGARVLVSISVVPTAGYADEEIETTPGELALVDAVVAALF